MSMIVIDTVQGSDDWLNIRLNNFGASEAPAMMGASKYQKREDLLKLKKTGIAPEVNEATQRLFDKGHEAEASILPHIEAIIKEHSIMGDSDELKPKVGLLKGTKILASFDGLSSMEDIVFEHKLLNAKLFEAVKAINEGADVELHPHYTIQLDQQLLVSGAEKAIFVCSDGTPDNMAYCWYETTEEKKQAIIDGWIQFEKDLAAYEVKEEKVKPVAEYIPALPALRVQVTGQVTETNLDTYKATALAFIEGINTNLVTDEDFVNAEKTIKFCKDAEKELQAVKQNALAQTATIDDLFRTVDDLSEAMRQKRLTLDKLVKTQKEVIKASIAAKAKESLQLEWETLVENLNPAIVPTYCPVRLDIAAAMKGKKNIDSLESAANDELARAKIEATKLAAKFEANLACFDEEANKHKFLFNDIAELVHKETGDFKAVVLIRIADHEEREKARIEAERERIAAEERAKLQREQAEKEAEQAEPVQHELTCSREFTEEKAPDPLPKAKPKAKAPLMTTLKAWAKSKGLNDNDVVELMAILTEYNYQSDAA